MAELNAGAIWMLFIILAIFTAIFSETYRLGAIIAIVALILLAIFVAWLNRR